MCCVFFISEIKKKNVYEYYNIKKAEIAGNCENFFSKDYFDFQKVTRIGISTFGFNIKSMTLHVIFNQSNYKFTENLKTTSKGNLE